MVQAKPTDRPYQPCKSRTGPVPFLMFQNCPRWSGQKIGPKTGHSVHHRIRRYNVRRGKKMWVSIGFALVQENDNFSQYLFKGRFGSITTCRAESYMLLKIEMSSAILTHYCQHIHTGVLH